MYEMMGEKSGHVTATKIEKEKIPGERIAWLYTWYSHSF